MILWIRKYLTIIATISVAFFVALVKAFFLGKKLNSKKNRESFKNSKNKT